MESKITLNYKYEGCGEYAPVDASFEIPGYVTITQLLYQVENFMKACGYVFDGRLELVEDTYEEFLDKIPEDQTIWPADYDGYENEPEGGCMADFDKECGCESTSSPLEKFNEGLDKLKKEIKTQRKIREMANKSADMVKDFNDAYEKLTEEQKMKAFKEACTMSGLHYEATKETPKNKWVHGICNPPSPDWKAQNK